MQIAVASLLTLSLIGIDALAQTAPAHRGVSEDWTRGHVVFTRDGLAKHPDLIYREPRVLAQTLQRWPLLSPMLHTSTANSGAHDWSQTLGGGRLAINMYPAKFTFDPTLPPDCTNDYVVFGLNVPGATGGQANLIALNNLYSGTCTTGTVPNVMFAYNITTVTGGKVALSPVISLKGDKIAFVESTGAAGPAIFHVITWQAGQGAVKNAVTPLTDTAITFSSAANSTTSSPWLDFANDVAYLGADDGTLHKITGVFLGAPTEVKTGGWPLTVVSGKHLTSPVLDSVQGLLMIGGSDGKLYQVNTLANPVTATSVAVGSGFNPGIKAPPIVDLTNGITFAVSADDGTSGVLVQYGTAALNLLQKASIGVASANAARTTVNLRQPALSNAYYNSDFANGVIRVCGTGTGTDISPWEYSFGFSLVSGTPVMNSSPSLSLQLMTGTLTSRCTDWIEFFNPSIGAGGTEFFFFGVTQACTVLNGGTADGCVASTTGDAVPTTVTIKGGTSGIVIDNFRSESGASNVYFTAEATTNTAYQYPQVLP